MNKKIFFIFYIFYLLIIEILNFETIHLNFNTEKKDTNNLNIYEYLNIIKNNDIYSSLKIGTPKQIINIYFKFSRYTSYLSNNYYNENFSSSYIAINNESRNFSNEEFESGKRSKEIYIFNSLKKEINFPEYLFIYTDKYYKPEFSKPGVFGLKLSDNSINELKETNMITQLKNKDIISNYIFSIKYSNDNEGNIFIGSYPHEFDKKNYFENSYITTKSNNDKNKVKWGLNFNKIYYNNEQYSIINDKNAEFEIEYGFIEGVLELQNILNEQFFNKNINNNLCTKDVFEDKENLNNYEFYMCNKKVISSFQDINFYQKELDYNFILTYKDLFLKYKNDNYIFLIIFDKFQSLNWKFGKPFFKKYFLTFDQDKKLIGLYKNKITKNKNLYISQILFIVIILILFYIIYKLLKYIKEIKKKKKAYLLIDDYEYNDVNNNKNINKNKFGI